MLNRYIIWTIDASFSYEGPYGTMTEEIYEEHGFEIEVNSKDIPDLTTLKGFGAFEDVEKVATYEGLFDYIEDVKGLIYEDDKKEYDEQLTLLQTLLELQIACVEGKKKYGDKNFKLAA